MTNADLEFLENYKRIRSIFGKVESRVAVHIPEPPPPPEKIVKAKKAKPPKPPKKPKPEPEVIDEDLLKVMRVRGRDSGQVLKSTKEVLRLANEHRVIPYTSREIIERVSEAFGVPASTIYKPCRLRKTVIAKHLVFWWVRKERWLSYGQIAKTFKYLDPSSIKHAVQQISKFIEVIEKDETKPLDTN